MEIIKNPLVLIKSLNYLICKVFPKHILLNYIFDPLLIVYG